MVKRTGEVVMGIFAIIFSFGFTVLGVLFNAGANNDEFSTSFQQSFTESDPTLTSEDADLFLGVMQSLGTGMIWLGIIAGIIGILAVIFITKNKKPVLSGILFIVGALIIGIGTIGAGFVPGLLYLISGIMALVRKPKPMDTAL